MVFADRAEAGEKLAAALLTLPLAAPVIAALPRGGVPVARPIADALGAPLTLLMVRKLGVPGHEEFAFGALGEDGIVITDAETVAHAGLTEEMIESIRAREQDELERRAATYGAAPVVLTGRTVVIVDDGMATGSTMHAAVDVAHHRGATRIVIAVPVAAREAVESFMGQAEVVTLETPAYFGAVGSFYELFTQVTDAEVVDLLR
jgi:putative phosphoribosyl transferase